jgi:hypothetical protein
MLNFDYKICNLNNYLDTESISKLNLLVSEFKPDLNRVRSNLGFLQWSQKVQDKLIERNPKIHTSINNNGYLTLENYFELESINSEFGFYHGDYFNFFLSFAFPELKESGIYEILNLAYRNIIKDIFGKEIKPEYFDTLISNANIYPKGSFIKKHQDNDPDGKRLFTILFFLNNDRKIEDGSVLKLYTKDGVVDVISDCNQAVIIEHQNYNYTHEVTKNLIDNVRYSLYCPFTTEDYNKKLM